MKKEKQTRIVKRAEIVIPAGISKEQIVAAQAMLEEMFKEAEVKEKAAAAKKVKEKGHTAWSTLPQSQYDQLVAFAKSTNGTVASVVRQALTEFFDRQMAEEILG